MFPSRSLERVGLADERPAVWDWRAGGRRRPLAASRRAVLAPGEPVGQLFAHHSAAPGNGSRQQVSSPRARHRPVAAPAAAAVRVGSGRDGPRDDRGRDLLDGVGRRGRRRPPRRTPRATRSAPARLPIAAWTAARRRSGDRRLWCSRTPASAISTRRATSNWSRQNGTTQTGTPAASARWVVPCPPWETTHAARAMIGPCGQEALDARVRGRREGRGVDRGGRHDQRHVLARERLERRGDQALVGLVGRRRRHEHDRAGLAREPVRRIGRRLPGARSDEPDRRRPVAARVLVRLGGEGDEPRRLAPLVVEVAQRREAEPGPDLVALRHVRGEQAASPSRVPDAVARAAGGAARRREAQAVRRRVGGAQRRRIRAVGRPREPRGLGDVAGALALDVDDAARPGAPRRSPTACRRSRAGWFSSYQRMIRRSASTCVRACQSSSSIASMRGSTGGGLQARARRAARRPSGRVRTWTSWPRRRSSSSMSTTGKSCPGAGRCRPEVAPSRRSLSMR